jgi:hypothetical protein
MLGGSFLGGAQDRLLPATIPFRFFMAAALFHIAAWAVLLRAAPDVPDFAGGTGPILAAIHLLTLGVLAMVAMGASFQLLPVATRQPLARTWPARLSFWLITAGTAVLAFSMADGATETMNIGASSVAVALLIFAGLTADNLRRAGGLPVVAAHGWVALVALLGVVGLGLVLNIDFQHGFLNNHQALAHLHMLLALFGFMGVLALGFSLVLIPMFALSQTPSPRLGGLQLGLAALALTLTTGAVLTGTGWLFWPAITIAIAASGVYLWQMHRALRTGMRKRLGLSFRLIRLSWASLPIAWLLGLAILLDLPVPNAPVAFGLLVLVGWLLTFLLGILQRIIPFLASMHIAGADGLPVLMSDLTPDLPLKVHAGLHCLAVLLCLAGILLRLTLLVQIGAAAGLIGALAYAGFVIAVSRQVLKQT